MDTATAEKVLQNCSLAFDPLNSILLDRSPGLSDEDFANLRHRAADALAHIVDFQIEPALTMYPDLDPFH